MDGLSFVQLIEAELKKRNISKETFYRESGISSATLSQWRRRIYSPSSAAIKKVEDFFGIELSLETKKVSTTNGERQPDILDEVDIAFYGEYKQLTDDDKDTIRDMVRIMRERRAKKQE